MPFAQVVPVTRLELVRYRYRGIFGGEYRCCPYLISTGVHQVPCVYLFHHTGIWCPISDLNWKAFALVLEASVFTNFTNRACGCERLDSNQRSPPYEGGEIDLFSTPQYWAVITSYPGRHLNGWRILQVGISWYNHRQSPPLDYLQLTCYFSATKPTFGPWPLNQTF